MSLWERLAERVVPANALSGIGRVGWRVVDDSGAPRILGGTAVPVSNSLLADAGWWSVPHGSTWRQWPTLHDLLGTALGAQMDRLR